MRPNRFAIVSVFVLASVTSAAAWAQPGAARAPDPDAYRVQVTGAVRYPGRVTLTPVTMTVADAIAAVGAQTLDAGDQVVVIHPGQFGEPAQSRILNRGDVDRGAPGVDLSLQDGDIVNVPLGQRFYISGFVKRPGAYRLPAGTTVSQAIVQAGGLADTGTERRVRVVRLVNGKHVESAAQPGDRVLPNDEIKVPRRMF